MENKDISQMHLPGFEQLEPPKILDKNTLIDNENKIGQIDVPSLAINQDALPASLKASVETSIDLRGVQRRLTSLLTQKEYVDAIAAYKPEVLPELLNSVTNGIAVSDNLMIQTMREASKNSTTNKVLECLIQQNKTISKNTEKAEKNEYYDESIDKIKDAIFHKLDRERNKKKKTAKDYIDPMDTEVIEAEYEDITEGGEKNE